MVAWLEAVGLLLRHSYIQVHTSNMTTCTCRSSTPQVICAAVGQLLKQQSTIRAGISIVSRRADFRIVQRCCFSSTEEQGDDEGGSLKKKGPVKIKETARSSAAARLRPRLSSSVLPGSSTMNTTTTDARPVVRKKGGEDNSQKQPTVTKSLHPAHHFISGGMPCDPLGPAYHLAEYGEESLYTLILLRHGESEWNQQNRYTGWCDVNLTDAGRHEARTAGRLLYENGIEMDQAFTSVLKRAAFSCNMALNAAEQHWVPITKTWRLNERHYGALQGKIIDWQFVKDLSKVCIHLS